MRTRLIRVVMILIFCLCLSFWKNTHFKKLFKIKHWPVLSKEYTHHLMKQEIQRQGSFRPDWQHQLRVFKNLGTFSLSALAHPLAEDKTSSGVLSSTCAPITKYRRQVGTREPKQQCIFSALEGTNPRSNVDRSSFFRGLFLGLQTATFSLCPHRVFPLCMNP